MPIGRTWLHYEPKSKSFDNPVNKQEKILSFKSHDDVNMYKYIHFYLYFLFFPETQPHSPTTHKNMYVCTSIDQLTDPWLIEINKVEAYIYMTINNHDEKLLTHGDRTRPTVVVWCCFIRLLDTCKHWYVNSSVIFFNRNFFRGE